MSLLHVFVSLTAELLHPLMLFKGSSSALCKLHWAPSAHVGWEGKRTSLGDPPKLIETYKMGWWKLSSLLPLMPPLPPQLALLHPPPPPKKSRPLFEGRFPAAMKEKIQGWELCSQDLVKVFTGTLVMKHLGDWHLAQKSSLPAPSPALNSLWHHKGHSKQMPTWHPAALLKEN